MPWRPRCGHRSSCRPPHWMPRASSPTSSRRCRRRHRLPRRRRRGSPPHPTSHRRQPPCPTPDPIGRDHWCRRDQGNQVVAVTKAIWAAAVAVGAHAGPALTTVAPLRVRFMPGLSGIGRRTHVALTFDDGPDPEYTPAVLDRLDTLSVRATFFLLGTQTAKHPTLA